MNIILLTIDSLRADHLEVYGYSKITAPFLNQFAQEAVLFKQAYAAGPNTQGSMPVLLTGILSSRFGRFKPFLVEERKTLAETLQEAGFVTGGFHSNPYLGAEFNYNRGFEVFWDFQDIFGSPGKILGKKGLGFGLQHIGLIGKRLFHRWSYIPADEMTHEALKFIRLYEKQNFFLWTHYMDVHNPYLSHEDGVDNHYARSLTKKMIEDGSSLSNDEVNTLIRLYDGEISYVDKHLKVLIEGLKVMELYEDSMIIITADHGDEFLDHGGFSHNHKLYEELIHVPLFIRFPKGEHAGEVFNEPVSLLDLAPTMMEVAGIKSDMPLDGINLPPFIGGKREYKDRIIMSEVDTFLFSVRRGPWKLIYNRKSNTRELYHLVRDPTETINLANTETRVFNELMEIMEKHIASIPGEEKVEREKVEYEEDVRQRLRDLGYIE